LEYAELHLNLNGRLRLRGQEGRAGLEEVIGERRRMGVI
jgi:hypothetical protein